jgi:hypothetical protein
VGLRIVLFGDDAVLREGDSDVGDDLIDRLVGLGDSPTKRELLREIADWSWDVAWPLGPEARTLAGQLLDAAYWGPGPRHEA